MRCRYTFTVISDTKLPTSVKFKRGVTEFTLTTIENRFVALVVEQPSVKMNNLGKLTPGVNGQPGHVLVPSDTLLPFIQMELRVIRGALSLWGVHDIEIESPKVDWLPETPEEKNALQISGFKFSYVAPGALEPRLMPIDQLVRPFLSWERLRPMEIPMEFFRRGREDLGRNHFVEAIYDFYFVLEFLFADGKFTKHAVREALLKSDEAKRIIADSQRHPLPDIRENSTDLASFNARYRNRTVAEVVDTLTDLRGFLHHQSITRKQNWNPASPDEFKVDAYFLCALAHSAVLNLTTTTLFQRDEDVKFVATPMATADGRKITLKPILEPPGAEQFQVPPTICPS